MIRVNLAGTARRKPVKTGRKIALPTSFTPIALILIVVGSAGGGYWWYSNLASQTAELNQQISQAEAQKAALDAVIKQDQVYEARKKALENRVAVIEALEKSHVSPVVALDQLAEAVEKTQYVWLSSLDENNSAITLTGTGTSLNAIADFYSNLTATGYFKNIDLGPSQETAGNFSFSLKCDFVPPRAPANNPALVGGY